MKESNGDIMKIRYTKLEDYKIHQSLMEQVHEIHKDARPDIFVEYEKLPLLVFRNLLESDERVNLVLEVDGRVIGICDLKVATDKFDQKRLILSEICIDKEHIDKGYGTKFIDGIVTFLKEKNYVRIELSVWNFNEKAIKFYEKLGFKTQKIVLEKELI